MFEEVVMVDICEGEGVYWVPREMLGSVRAGSLRTTGSMCGLAASTAEVIYLGDQVLVAVTCVDLGHGIPAQATVCYEGVSIESPEPWKRYTEAQYLSNRAFYRKAHYPD
jgi:hypothetical protein